MRTQAWYFQKSSALSEAWRGLFGSYPPRCAVVLSLAVAIHETNAGDAKGWEGEHNWGAVQLRSPNDAERAVLASVKPSPKNTQAARDALAAAGLEEPKGALHADWSPTKHDFYWVYFAKFGSDVDGARYFLNVLAKKRPTCCVVLRDPYGTERALAERMHQTGYYEGFQSPAKHYKGSPGHWVECDASDPNAVSGAEADIQDYTWALSRLTPDIKIALASWTPGDPAPNLDDLGTILGQQRALNRHGASPPLAEDGIRGPKMIGATIQFQKDHSLTPDGIIGPKTKAALAAP